MSEGESVIIPFFDTPVQTASPFPSKESLERAQLEKYRLDYLLRFGKVPFEDVRCGDNPPDFLVTRHATAYGVDCAALALQKKRNAEALFTKLIQKVAADDSASLQHLNGTHVTIWFKEDTELPPRPPRVANTSTAQELIEALEYVDVDRDQIARTTAEIAEHGWPETLPVLLDGLAVVDKERFGFQVEPVNNWQPSEPLSAQLGFGVSLSFPLMIQDVRAEMKRLVSDHDNGRIEQLLVSIGGPNRDGICFPAEHILGSFLKEEPIEPVSAQHIGQVTAHIWTSGELFDVPVRRS
jgi:hypothetical protein